MASLEGQINEKNSTLEQLIAEASTKKTELDASIATTSASITTLASTQEELERTKATIQKDTAKQSKLVSDILQKATAGSLFQSFNMGKDEHHKATIFWLWGLGGSVVVAILVALALVIVDLIYRVPFSGYAVARFAVITPAIYAIVFCQQQYVRNRQLEEAYGFKAAISLSLEAYRDLLKQEAGTESSKDVVPVITDAVKLIFRSPAEENHKFPSSLDANTLEAMLGPITNLVKEVKK